MSLVDSLDWEKIITAINESPQDDLEECTEIVYHVLGRYLERDQKEYVIHGVEERFEYDREGIFHTGIIDLWGSPRNKSRDLVIIDWKETKRLDDWWAWREGNSPQGETYAHSLVSIRGGVWENISLRVRGIGPGGETRECVRNITPLAMTEVDKQDWMWHNLVVGLTQGGEGLLRVWPRNMPEGCSKYTGKAKGPGASCVFWDRCKGLRPQIEVPEEFVPRQPRLSYTWMKNFKICPELARQLELLKQLGFKSEDSIAAEHGKAVHRGLAEAYQQVMRREG